MDNLKEKFNDYMKGREYFVDYDIALGIWNAAVAAEREETKQLLGAVFQISSAQNTVYQGEEKMKLFKRKAKVDERTLRRAFKWFKPDQKSSDWLHGFWYGYQTACLEAYNLSFHPAEMSVRHRLCQEIQENTWFYRNCKKNRAKNALICKTCPIRYMIEHLETAVGGEIKPDIRAKSPD